MSRLSSTPSPIQIVEADSNAGGSSDDGVDEMELKLRNGWSRYNEQWSKAKAIRVGHIVYLNGLIKGGNKGHITTLPVGWRPRKQKMFCQATNGMVGGTECSMSTPF